MKTEILKFGENFEELIQSSGPFRNLMPQTKLDLYEANKIYGFLSGAPGDENKSDAGGIHFLILRD